MPMQVQQLDAHYAGAKHRKRQQKGEGLSSKKENANSKGGGVGNGGGSGGVDGGGGGQIEAEEYVLTNGDNERVVDAEREK